MTAPTVAPARLGSISPFFIVRDIEPSVAFYCDRLGFALMYLGPDGDPYYAMVQRDGVSIMLKAITSEVGPVPNSSRHEWARWDAYIHTPDPDALAAEFAARGVSFRQPLGVNSDRLRG